MKLVKSYKPLLVWFLTLVLGLTAVAGISSKLEVDPKIASLLVTNTVSVLLVGLMLIIYRTQRIYYINYVTYKEAAALSEEKRKQFAYQHLMAFVSSAILFGIYTVISIFFKIPMMLDVVVFAVLLVVTAIRTVPFSIKDK